MKVRCLDFGFCSLSVVAVLAYQVQPPVGSIHGVVVNELGQPVIAAKVFADLLDGLQHAKALISAETDNEGKFTVDRLEWGPYRIDAQKESEGYPDTSFDFYSEGRTFTASVSPGKPVANIRVVIGPKAGVISGSIADAITGAPVNATFNMRRVRSPNMFIGTSVPPQFRVLIPPRTEVLVEVHAPGYNVWYYPGSSSQSAPLRLQSSETVTLDVKLDPKVQ